MGVVAQEVERSSTDGRIGGLIPDLQSVCRGILDEQVVPMYG